MLTIEVARRCEQKLGLGDFPIVRRRLYRMLQRICEQRGQLALQIVADVLDEAQGPQIRNAGQFFAFSVTRRLRECGLWVGDGSATAPTPAQKVQDVDALKRTTFADGSAERQRKLDEANRLADDRKREEIYKRMRDQAVREERWRLAADEERRREVMTDE